MPSPNLLINFFRSLESRMTGFCDCSFSMEQNSSNSFSSCKVNFAKSSSMPARNCTRLDGSATETTIWPKLLFHRLREDERGYEEMLRSSVYSLRSTDGLAKAAASYKNELNSKGFDDDLGLWRSGDSAAGDDNRFNLRFSVDDNVERAA